MDLTLGGAVGSVEEQENSNLRKGKRTYHRHTSYQTAKLEALFKDCPHPDENQRRQIAMELGLEPKQIKFWFQNKRTQRKTQNERADNTALRAENERMQSENIVIREALKTVVCPSCGGPPFGDEEHQLFIQKLQQENAQLKEEHEKVSNLLARYMEKPRSKPAAKIPTKGSLCDLSLGISLNQAVESPPLGQDFVSATSNDDALMLKPTSQSAETEKALMSKAAATAAEELVKLLRAGKPLWVKSSPDGKLGLHRESYEKMFPSANHLESSNGRVESSKDSRIVGVKGMQLVEMFLDSDQWANVFSTIVTKARTIHVLESGLPENRSGALQLMYEEMHILSHLVPSREFYFLRYCQQVEADEWVIADVSFDYLKEKTPLSRSWRLPSGCMIHELPNGSSKVTWVEHVEVDDKIQAHRLYRDLVVCSSVAYGAERWLMELQRMCERFAVASLEKAPSHDTGGVINEPEGRRSVMKLSHRMVKNFFAILNMPDKLEFPHLSEVDDTEIRISVRKNTELGTPSGTIVIAATSLCLPLPSQHIFDFFKDEKKRVQWDVLNSENPMQEISHISNGTHPGNYISIIQPTNPTENAVMILQENFINPLGSYVVYAPVNLSALNVAMRDEDSLAVPILPSGIVISGDGRHNTAVAGAHGSGSGSRLGGSLLTLAFQMLVCSPSAIRELDVESVAAVKTLLTSTIQKIKDGLNCCELE